MSSMWDKNPDSKVYFPGQRDKAVTVAEIEAAIKAQAEQNADPEKPVTVFRTGSLRAITENHLQQFRNVLKKARDALDLYYPDWQTADCQIRINYIWWDGECAEFTISETDYLPLRGG